MMDAELLSGYFLGNLELIVIINFFFNNQKGSFDITLPGKTS